MPPVKPLVSQEFANWVLRAFGKPLANYARRLYQVEVGQLGTALQNIGKIRELKEAMGVTAPLSFSRRVRGGHVVRDERLGKAVQVMAHPMMPPSVLAHEFGHASGRPIFRFTQDIHVPLGIGIGLYGQVAGEKDTAEWTSLAPIGLAAPQIAEEARASIRGLRYLKKVGLHTPLAYKGAAAALGTYIASPLALSAMFYGASRLKKDNRFDGMQEGGLAAALRKRNTDFGSGYQGLESLTEKQLKEVDTPEEYFQLFDQALRQYGVLVGTGHKRIAIPKELLSKQEIIENLGFIPVSVAIPEAGQVVSRSFRHPRLLHHIHEHKNFWTMHVDRHSAATMELEKYKRETKKVGEEPSFWKKLGIIGAGMKHVFTEGIPGAYYYIKGRLAGVPDMVERFASDVESGYWHLVSKLETASKKGPGFFSNLFNRADKHITIEGMQEQGLSSKMRKENTEFGSKYDVMRAAAKSLGTTFERLTARKGWREALSQGRVVSELGAGRFGRAELMETEYQGMRFQYVRKTVERERGVEWLGPVAREHPEFVDPMHEALMLRPHGKSETIPSLYGVNLEENTLYMEYMPGTPVWRLAEQGKPIPDSVAAALHHDIKQMIRTNQVNTDIHGENILYDPVTGRTSWVDMGGSMRIEAAERKAARWQMEGGVEMVYHHVGQPLPGTRIMAAARQAEDEALGLAPTLPVPKRITGMVEFGMAPTKRKLNTPFGSPWRGLVGLANKVNKALFGKTLITRHLGREVAPSAALLLDPRKAAQVAKGQTLEQFAARIKQPAIVVRTPEDEKMFEVVASMWPDVQSGGAWIRHPGLKQFVGKGPPEGIIIHPAKVRQLYYEQTTAMGLDPSVAKRAVESEDFLKTVLYHEVLEKQTRYRFKRLTRMEEAGASHNASQVLLGEGGFVQATGNEDLRKLFMTMRSQRPAEYSAFSAGLHAFSEEGTAPYLRMILSDFGSGYRGLMASTSRKVTKAATRTARHPDAQTLTSIDLHVAQRQIWHCANYGGKYHNRRSNGFVHQLSRFGGGV